MRSKEQQDSGEGNSTGERSRPQAINSLSSKQHDFGSTIVGLCEKASKNGNLMSVGSGDSYVDRDKLNARIGEALASCEVETTPEVREAIKGFYEDHYSFAELTQKAIDNTITLEDCCDVLDSSAEIIEPQQIERYTVLWHKEEYELNRRYPMTLPSVRHAAVLLASIAKDQLLATNPEQSKALRRNTLQQASLLLGNIFAENALPITTIGETEFAMIGQLHDHVAKTSMNEFPEVKLVDGRIHWGYGSSAEPKDVLVDCCKSIQREFWQDTRMAGQLLYHNTGYLDEILLSDALMSRREQQRRSGTYRHATADAGVLGDFHHSNAVHFSETYTPRTYKCKNYGGRIIRSDTSGTIAVPLINVIDVAPYARDAKYSVVTAMPEVCEKVPVNDVVDMVNAPDGGNDYPGSIARNDRVFFAASTQFGDIAPDQYSICIGGGCKPGARNTLVFIKDGNFDEVSTSYEYGVGTQFPGRLLIDPAVTNTMPFSRQYDPDNYSCQIFEASQPEAAIKQLQAYYIEQNEGKIVVPLRRGVFDFIPGETKWGEPGWRATASISYKRALHKR